MLPKLHAFLVYCIGEHIPEVELLANATGNDWDIFEESLKQYYIDYDPQQLECRPSSPSTSSPLPLPTIMNNYDLSVDSMFSIILAELNSIIVASRQQPYPMPMAYQSGLSQESSKDLDE